MIYMLEDDDGIRKLVLYTLKQSGLEAKGFAKPTEFWEAMEEKSPDLILLDIMLPEEDGLVILKRLRSSSLTKSLPIMMLTAKGTEYDKVMGLNYGADDYVSKPFGMMELVARIRALLRRVPAAEEGKAYSWGNLYVSPSKHLVKVADKSVSLTLKEFELLCVLMGSPDIVFTRDQLLNQIWGYDFDGESRTVDVHIRTLRQKLGEASSYIETVRGIGYRMVTE